MRFSSVSPHLFARASAAYERAGCHDEGVLSGELVTALAVRSCAVVERRNPEPSLRLRVVNVVRLSPEEKMVRSHAWAIVAAMEDAHPIGDRADRVGICKPVRVPTGAFPVDLVNKRAISARLLSPCPQPTIIGFDDESPEAQSRRYPRVDSWHRSMNYTNNGGGVNG